MNDDLQLRLMADADNTMLVICRHIEAGGSLVSLCETWDVSFGAMNSWVRQTDDRKKAYLDALSARAEWSKERVLMELQSIAISDLRLAYNEDGSLRHPSEWPDELARVVSSIETLEEFDGSGDERQLIGYTKKLKLWDKPKALEMWGKTLALFIEKHEHSGKVTLEDILAASRPKEEK